jgi:hypothetical protein
MADIRNWHTFVFIAALMVVALSIWVVNSWSGTRDISRVSHYYLSDRQIRDGLDKSGLNIRYIEFPVPRGGEAIVSGIATISRDHPEVYPHDSGRVGFAFILAPKGKIIDTNELYSLGHKLRPRNSDYFDADAIIHGIAGNVSYATYFYDQSKQYPDGSSYFPEPITIQLDKAFLKLFPKNDPEVFPILTKP